MKYRKTFFLTEKESEAKDFVYYENHSGSAYKRRVHKAKYFPYTTNDGWEGYIVWYYTK
jgi:hypothetical protein